MILTDSHAHLESVASRLGAGLVRGIAARYAEAGAEARAAGRPAPLLLDVGVEPGDLARRRALLGEEDATLRFSAGVWPSRAALEDPGAALEALGKSLASPAARGLAAIGECGFDRHHDNGSPAAQLLLFEGQAALARSLGLPLIVHSREAAGDTAAAIRALGGAVPVVIHCFGYGPEEAALFLDLGCHLSFAGNLCYASAEALRDALALVPDGRLLLETDSPYLNPGPRRGAPTTPLDIERSYALAAGLRGVTVEALAGLVAANARALFG